MSGIPEHLYKYRRWDEEFAKEIFIDNLLYFASPSEFNDPFDCRVHFRKSKYSKKDLEDFIDSRRQLSFGHAMTRIERMCVKEQMKKTRPKRKYFASKAERRFQEYIDGEIRVLSLSACPDSILMWGHYSYNHQGFCLKFRTGEGGMFDAAGPVNYSVGRPLIDYVKDPLEKRVMDVMFTKSDAWSYEQEWRIVTPRSSMPKKYPFSPEALVGVIFGCRMRQDVKDKIKKWLGESRCKPRLYQARIKDLEFGLDIVPE